MNKSLVYVSHLIVQSKINDLVLMQDKLKRINKKGYTYFRYEVTDLSSILKIIKHFDQYPLQTSKFYDFLECLDFCYQLNRTEVSRKHTR